MENKLAFIGREYNPVWDTKNKELTKFNLLDKNPLKIDFTDKQHSLIIAKSGAGKSYLAGVYAEGLHGGMQNYGVLIIDPLGIFTTLKYPNTNQVELQSWNDQFPGEVVPEGIRNCEMWVPAGDQKQFPEGRYDGLFSLSACDLTPGTLCTSFDMDPLEPQLRLYRKAQKHLLKEQGNYALDELTGWIRKHGVEDLHYKDQTVEALISKLEALEELGLITTEGITLPQMVREGVVVVINLSASDEYTARVIVNFLAEKILELRKKGKQLVDDLEVKHIKVDRPDWYIPPVQFVIDEAHNFLPKNRILRRCVKEGRNCALLITAISQAMDLDKKIYGNVTHLFVGALTFNDDIEDVYRILPVDWTPKDFRKEIKILVPGCFWYFNAEKKRAQLIRVRPRQTLHLASTKLMDERKYFIGEKDEALPEITPPLLPLNAPVAPQSKTSSSGPAAPVQTNVPALPSVVDIHRLNGTRPAFDVYIGRATQGTEFNMDSKWANPYRPQNYADPKQCLVAYENYIRTKIKTDPVRYNLEELEGKRLGCWCITNAEFPPREYVCHGQILMKLVQEQVK